MQNQIYPFCQIFKTSCANCGVYGVLFNQSPQGWWRPTTVSVNWLDANREFIFILYARLTALVVGTMWHAVILTLLSNMGFAETSCSSLDYHSCIYVVQNLAMRQELFSPLSFNHKLMELQHLFWSLVKVGTTWCHCT